MKTKSKNVRGGLWVLAFSLYTFAFQGRGDVGLGSVQMTNRLAALSTNTTTGAAGCGVAIDLRNYSGLALQVQWAGSGASASNFVLNLVRGAYSTNFESEPSVAVTVPVRSTETTNVVWVDVTTNLGPAVAWVRIASAWNTATNAVSNLVVTAVRKKIR